MDLSTSTSNRVKNRATMNSKKIQVIHNTTNMKKIKLLQSISIFN